MKQLKVGIIGIQGFGRRHAELLTTVPNVAIRAACDIREEALAGFARQYGIPQTFTDYRNMLAQADVDCVTIATPHHLHPRMVTDALLAGKHVLCEKPLAIRAADADIMVALAKQKRLKLACHYIFRLAPQIIGLKKAYDAGLLGEVYYVSMRWLARHTDFWFREDTGWRVVKAQAGGGILMGRGSHLIDAIWYVLGKPPVTSVYATCSNRLVGQEVEDFAAASIRFANGCQVNLECSYVLHLPEHEQRHEYEVYGTKGGAIARLLGARPGLFVGRCELPGNEWTDLLPVIGDETSKAEPSSVIEDFILAVREDRPPLVSGEDAAIITHIIEAAYRSADEGREIKLE